MGTIPSLWNQFPAFSAFENPMREMMKLQRRIDRLFEEVIPTNVTFDVTSNIKEVNGHYVMTFDIPGVKKEDLKINLQDNFLTVSAERKDERRGESYYGAYEKSLMLTPGVKPEQIEADYKDGVLRIAFPKTASSKGNMIKIGESKPGFFDRLLGHKKQDSKEKAA